MTNDAATGLRSYRPGDWYAVLGDEVAVLVPPSERSRVAALWELVDGGADADEVLDALIAGGLRSLPGFVLLADVGDRRRIVLRGAVRAGIDTFDGPVALDGTDATTWVERVLPGVRTVRIEVDDRADGPDRPIDAGLVRVARLDQPPYVEPAPAMAPVPTPERAEVPPPPPAPPAPPAPPVEPRASFPTGDEPTEAIALSDLPPPPPFPPPPPPAPPTFPPPAPREPEPEPVPEPAVQDEPEADRPVAVLTFAGGDVVEVDRAVIVGRAPEAGRFSTAEDPRLVTVPSPHQEISSTHLEVRPGTGADQGSAVVTDLGSTNGTVLVQPGEPPEVLQPGVAVQLLPGAVIDLGDGVTIEVARP